MTEIRTDPARATGASGDSEHARLRKAAHDFEGVFLAQMFKEMRATVPAEESVPGQEVFTEMLDDRMANEAAGRSTRGLGEALYRQLAARLDGTTHQSTGTE